MNHASLCSLNADSTQFVNNDPDMILIEDNAPSDQLLCYYLSSQKLLFWKAILIKAMFLPWWDQNTALCDLKINTLGSKGISFSA